MCAGVCKGGKVRKDGGGRDEGVQVKCCDNSRTAFPIINYPFQEFFFFKEPCCWTVGMCSQSKAPPGLKISFGPSLRKVGKICLAHSSKHKGITWASVLVSCFRLWHPGVLLVGSFCVAVTRQAWNYVEISHVGINRRLSIWVFQGKTLPDRIFVFHFCSQFWTFQTPSRE